MLGWDLVRDFGGKFRKEHHSSIRQPMEGVATECPFTISRTTGEDIPAILKLQRAAFRAEADALGDPNAEPLMQTEEDVEAEMERCVCLKCVEKGTGDIVGSVRGELMGDGQVVLHKMCVWPGLQGRGLGSRLLRAVEKELAGHRFLLWTCNVFEKNVRFYTRNGYVVMGEGRDVDGAPITLLQKDVPAA